MTLLKLARPLLSTLLLSVVLLAIAAATPAEPAQARGNKTCNPASRLGLRCPAMG